MLYNRKRRTSTENDVEPFDEKKKMSRYSDPLPPSIADSTMTAMHIAAVYNNIDVLKDLLDSGHDANVKSTSGLTPLLLAAHSNHFDAVILLLERKADVFVVDTDGKNVLEILMGKASLPLSVTTRLLNILMNCDVDAVRKADMLVRGNCELKIVLHLKDSRVTEEFLKRKCDITHGESAEALKFAMNKLDMENIRVLLQCGAEVNARKETFYRKLFNWCMIRKCRQLKYAKVYLERLPTWDVVNEDAMEDFYLFFSLGNRSVVELLLGCKIDVYINKKLGRNLLAHVFENPKLNAVSLLRDRKFDVNAKGEGGSSPLHFAARDGSKKYVTYLIDLGADIEIKNDRGRTPLVEAVANGRQELVVDLLQYGADIRAVVHDKFTVFDPFDKHFCEKTQRCFISHLIVNEVMGIPIEDSIRKRIKSNKSCERFYEQCYREIRDMQRIKITETFTLFHAVAGEVDEIARNVRDDKTTQLLNQYCRQRNIDEYYCTMMSYKLDKAKKMVMTKSNVATVMSDD